MGYFLYYFNIAAGQTSEKNERKKQAKKNKRNKTVERGK